jgi:hypothetical protein
MNTLQQQARFDDFVHEFQAERPPRGHCHEMPREVYTPSRRPYRGCRTSIIPSTTATSSSPPAAVSASTERKCNISIVLAGQRLGIKQVDEGIWLVSLIDYDLGYSDLEQRTLQPLDNRLSPGFHLCHRYVLLPMSPACTW